MIWWFFHPKNGCFQPGTRYALNLVTSELRTRWPRDPCSPEDIERCQVSLGTGPRLQQSGPTNWHFDIWDIFFRNVESSWIIIHFFKQKKTGKRLRHDRNSSYLEDFLVKPLRLAANEAGAARRHSHAIRSILRCFKAGATHPISGSYAYPMHFPMHFPIFPI